MNGAIDVDAIEPGPRLMADEVVERRSVEEACGWQYQEEHRKYAIVKWKDAQQASHVEVTEEVRLVEGVDEYSRDQESGEQEEEIGPAPAPPSDDEARPRHHAGGIRRAGEMEHQDH